MSAGGGQPLEIAEAAKGDIPALQEKILTPDKEGVIVPKDEVDIASGSDDVEGPLRGPNGEEYPTKRDLETLRRIKGHISPIIYTIAFIELCERFAYYGTTAVCMSTRCLNCDYEPCLESAYTEHEWIVVNFIQQPLPKGSYAGEAGTFGQPGALGRGQQASTGLVTFNSFWAYLMPLLGGYLSDTYWGKYKTIHVAVLGTCIADFFFFFSF